MYTSFVGHLVLLPWIMMVSRVAGRYDHCDVVDANHDVTF
jgi:hypothetical protein|tara:strand:+ start:205 stop:324 length:120 start_codon:yes stop_codon:yes gene_type:complete